MMHFNKYSQFYLVLPATNMIIQSDCITPASAYLLFCDLPLYNNCKVWESSVSLPSEIRSKASAKIVFSKICKPK